MTKAALSNLYTLTSQNELCFKKTIQVQKKPTQNSLLIKPQNSLLINTIIIVPGQLLFDINELGTVFTELLSLQIFTQLLSLQITVVKKLT